jgi:hypothetical protein
VEQGAYFIGMGDYIDFMSPSNRARFQNAGLYDTTVKSVDDKARSLVEDLWLKALKPSKGRWLGLLEGNQYPLLPVTGIGRNPSNTIVVEDDYASGEHLLIALRGQQWWLEDLGSSNGTLLNGQPLQEATIISVGDVITIGHTSLKLEL